MLWNRFCVVVVSVVCHGRAIPLLWQTLEHPSASVSASVSIALLEKADQLLRAFGAITLLTQAAAMDEETSAEVYDHLGDALAAQAKAQLGEHPARVGDGHVGEGLPDHADPGEQWRAARAVCA